MSSVSIINLGRVRSDPLLRASINLSISRNILLKTPVQARTLITLELKIAISIGSRNSFRAPIRGSPIIITYPKPCVSISSFARFPGPSVNMTVGAFFFEKTSLAFAGPGADVLGEMKRRRFGANSKIFSIVSSTASTSILDPVDTVLTARSLRSASSSRSSSNIGAVPMFPHLKTPTLTFKGTPTH